VTIEDQEAPARCRTCGAWLPRTALECPRCGAPRELEMGGLGRLPIPTRWLVAGGGGIALVIGAVIWILLQSPAPGPIAEGSPSPTPSTSLEADPASSSSPVVTPTPTATPDRTAFPAPTPRPTPQPTPLPPRPPLVLGVGYADIGSRGRVTAGTLRVRSYPGLDAEIHTTLEAGTEVLMYEGPVSVDGVDWYEVVFSALPYEVPNQVDRGWVAVGPTGLAPTLVAIDPPHCPSLTVSVSLLGAAGGLARRTCLAGSHEFTAVVDTCYEGPITPYDYDPRWLWFSCFSVFDLGSTVHLQIHFPPSVAQPDGLSRGSVVHLVGHVEDPAAAGCTVVVLPGSGVEEPTHATQQVFHLGCAAAFVLDEIQIVDQIDLPPLF